MSREPVPKIWVVRNGVRVAVPNTYGAVHGRRSTYTYRQCRCELCSEAERAYQRERNARRVRDPSRAPVWAHGTMRGYNTYGCRESCCRAAAAAYHRARRARVNARKRGDILDGPSNPQGG